MSLGLVAALFAGSFEARRIVKERSVLGLQLVDEG